MKYLQRLISLLFLVFSLCHCGDTLRDTEDYGNGLRAILLLNPAQHYGGYQRKDCLVCHNADLNLHREKGSPINVDELNETIRNNGDSNYCLTCHGPNGINTNQ